MTFFYHGNQYFIGHLSLSICLSIVTGWMNQLDTILLKKSNHIFFGENCFLISNNGLRDTKFMDYLLLNEPNGITICCLNHWLSLNPFWKIICCYNNKSVLLRWKRINFTYQIHCITSKRRMLDYWMKLISW